MSKAIVLDNNLKKSSDITLPEKFSDINSHNLYLYVKAYQASLRSNTASSKTRSEVRGGGKKPWAQKGRGGARAGSKRSPIFVGGGVAFGPSTDRNYYQKVNKKQVVLALRYALDRLAKEGSLFVVDYSVEIPSGKTKDAYNYISKLSSKDVLIVKDNVDEKSYLAFNNLSGKNIYLIDKSELNPYFLAVFKNIVIEKVVLDSIIGGVN